MTYEEARKIIGSLKAGDRPDTTKRADALMKAMDALEMQMPKKTYHPVGQRTVYCPACNRGLMPATFGTAFCCYCGQAIEWRV